MIVLGLMLGGSQWASASAHHEQDGGPEDDDFHLPSHRHRQSSRHHRHPTSDMWLLSRSRWTDECEKFYPIRLSVAVAREVGGR